MEIILVLIFLCIKSVYNLPLPYNQYAYMQARYNLTNRKIGLNYKEKIVNFYMENMKFNEFGQTKKYFYPSRPIELDLNNITSREIYKFLKSLPKGGNLHIHEGQMLERKKFLKILFNQSPEFDWLYICDKSSDPDCVKTPSICKCLNHSLGYFTKNVDKGWLKVKESNWTIDQIAQKTNLIGILNDLNEKIYPTDSNGRWKVANDYQVFSFYSDVIKYNKTRFEYLKACLDSSLDENVQLIEFRRSNFGSMFYFDTNGDRQIISAEQELDMLIEFKNNYIQQNPNFIDFIFLIYETRGLSKTAINSAFIKATKTQLKYPNMIRGFDLVGEEDQGHTLLFHSDTLIEGFNYSQSSKGSFNLVFHTAETNWPQDLEPAQYGDSVSTLENIYDAILLRTSRVGHGIGLFKYPDLYKYFKERQIAIEVCPASNQILGYVSDLRNHPAVNFFRNNIPIVLSGDDPGTFGYNDLTIDFYLAYMAWGLDLQDLKNIALNSITYSSVPSEIKQIGHIKFINLWDNFIDNIYENVCINKEKFINSNFNVSDLLPSFGPSDKSVYISLFGYGFQVCLCEKVNCYFDDLITEGELVKINEIKCKTPVINNLKNKFSVNVKVKIGDNFYQTYSNYTFIPTEMLYLLDDENILSSTKEPGNSQTILKSLKYLTHILVLVILIKYYENI